VTPADAPIQIVVELREGQVVAGLSESVEDIFEPSDTLGESDPFAAATDALGSDYAAILFSVSSPSSSCSRAPEPRTPSPTIRPLSRTSTTSTT
jgi:hypothetical protein